MQWGKWFSDGFLFGLIVSVFIVTAMPPSRSRPPVKAPKVVSVDDTRTTHPDLHK